MTGFNHVGDMTCCEMKDFFARFCQGLEDGTDRDRVAMGRMAQLLKHGYDKFRKNYQHLEPLSEIEDIAEFAHVWNKDVHGEEKGCEKSMTDRI